MADGQVLSVREAADAMGISAQRVRQMISNGQIPARRSSAGWLVPEAAVTARALNVRKGRPTGPRTAWAAIGLLDASARGSPADPQVRQHPVRVVADRRLRHRVLRLLAALPDPAQDLAPWSRLLSSRGQVRRMWAHPGVVDRLVADPAVSRGGDLAASVGGEGLAGGRRRLELYVAAGEADGLIRQYRMRDDPEGPVLLVVVPSSVPAELAPAPGQPVPAPAAVADLLEEDDVRARSAAVEQLRCFRHAVRAIGWLDPIAVAPVGHAPSGGDAETRTPRGR